MNIEPIGVLRSCFGEKFAVPRQPGLCPSAWGKLFFYEAYRGEEFLRGMDGFSHVWLIFGFHETMDRGWSPTVRPPRLGGNQRVGVFASRSTHRPNGLGLSLCRYDGIESTPQGPALLLGGVDLIDGTPVYDVKPYLAYAEALPDARCGYADESPPRREVVIGDAARADFFALPSRDQKVIEEVLALDPRPAAHDDVNRVYGALLCGWNVKFRVDDQVHLVAIEKSA